MKKNNQHLQDSADIPHVGHQGCTCWSWNPNLLPGPDFELCFDLSFLMRSILWLYQTQGMFIISVPDSDVTKNSDGSWKVSDQK